MGVARQQNVHPGAKLDQADTLASLHKIARFKAEDDAPGQDTRDLAEDHIELIALHGHHMGAHMQMTPGRPASAEDHQRADQIAAALGGAIERYKDYRVALAEGYRILKVISREPAGQRDLTDPKVQQTIRETLVNRKDQLLKAAYYEVQRNAAKVENYLARSITENAAKK